MTKRILSILTLLTPLIIECANAFVIPSRFFGTVPTQEREQTVTKLNLQHEVFNYELPFFAISQNDDQIDSALSSVSDPNILSQLADGVRTVAVGITALVFFFAGITLITAKFIVPQAAKQLEEETKKLRPDLWAEYQAQLREGETLEMRPDLLQELGNIMQPIILANAEAQAAGTSVTETESKTQGYENALKKEFDNNSMGAFDAEIIDKRSDSINE
mmetsp:Transcript_14592/g.20817  ORF Transcript_14592/g.20817 Transcript_14592/m.20817 type:complete len:218 (+) Transcript_14592:119-772(+)|eukprot:CAMPEP_0184864660 /NCGR_PEP_ID=MMETSP0580-20130426/15780_1 /TAXON_ID=1118495 /ORGANISM="Dactyliosolen fragilissimus" /LENGTH=217 /DNA_ID=CAMNT_0027363553 /DNA_START=30 /DNA_END=683 /DNA_ORIENTATION=-